MLTEQSHKNCYQRKINLFCNFCWCKSKIVKSAFQCLQWKKSAGPYSCKFALSVAQQNEMTDVKGVTLLQALKKNSQITPYENKHMLILFFNRWLSVHIAEFSGGSQWRFHCFCQLSCSFASGKLLHASLDATKFLAGPLEAWFCVMSLFAFTCLPCSQDAACSRHSFGSLQPGDPESPISFLLEEDCKLWTITWSWFLCFPPTFPLFSIAFTLTMCVYKYLLKILDVRTGQCCKCLLNTPYLNCKHSSSGI